jgi:hypothetical protein
MVDPGASYTWVPGSLLNQQLVPVPGYLALVEP